MTNERTLTEDNITISVFDAEDAPTADAVEDAEPKEEITTHNTTRGSYQEEIVNALNGTQPDLTVDSLVLGDATETTANITDGVALGNELFRVAPTDTFVEGQTFSAATFIDSTEGNGTTFEEAGLVSEQSDGSDLPINRFLIDDPGGLLSPKTDGETVTIQIEITQQDG